MRLPAYAFLLLASSSILLAACSGWHLRGSNGETSLDQRVALAGDNNAIYRELNSILSRRQLLGNSSNSGYTIALETADWNRRTASTSSTGNTNEYEIRLSLPYLVTAQPSNRVISQKTLKLRQTFNANDADDLAQNIEESQLRQRMSRMAANQILQDLQRTSQGQ